ncbi:3-phosphoglycerate dehydrogenase [Sulfolobales archaeon HS-7]|nr:3-phosphoglycerate dehydrogenase [Sulfolobales archaeon HS-7]
MRIFSTRKLNEKAREYLREWKVYEVDPPEDADAILCWPSEFSKYSFKSLKVVQTFSAGVDDFPFHLLKKGVRLFSNAGAYSVSVAEHAWGLILSLAKGIGKREREKSYVLNGKNLLILGAGGIGTEIARMGKYGFNMRVIGVSRSFKNPEFFDVRFGILQLDEVISEGDVIAISLPLNEQTRGLINYHRMQRMKEQSILVNVGRAEVVVYEDVVRILRERRGFRFGTDVFWRINGRENYDLDLWNFSNFTGTLHTAGGLANEEVLQNAIEKAVLNLRRVLLEGRGENEVKIEDYINQGEP